MGVLSRRSSVLHRLLKELTYRIHDRSSKKSGRVYKDKKTMIRMQQHKPVSGFFPIYLVGEEEEGRQNNNNNNIKELCYYYVPLEFLCFKTFQDFLERYGDNIHSNPNVPLTLPCSSLTFQAQCWLVSAQRPTYA